ncbi:MAG: hypothetical protein QG602_3908, partial [Verrucomicrobiota bacterium]|nr:hypothetical protein [Verrucomicrobiota bacterium]
ATVQSAGELLADLERRLADLRRVADAVYGRWFQGIDATGSSAPRTDSPVEPPR